MFHVKHHTRRRVRTLAGPRRRLPPVVSQAGKPGSKAAANSGRGPPKGPRPVGGAKEGGPPHALHSLLHELLRAPGAQKARGSKAPRGRDEIRLRRSREQRDAARRTQATGERDERARDGRAPKALEGGESADGHGRRHWGGPPLPAQPAVPSLLPSDRVDLIAWIRSRQLLPDKKNPRKCGDPRRWGPTRRRSAIYGITTLYHLRGWMSKSVIRKRAAAAKAKSGYRI